MNHSIKTIFRYTVKRNGVKEEGFNGVNRQQSNTLKFNLQLSKRVILPPTVKNTG